MKKVISLCLALILCLSMLPMAAVAEEPDPMVARAEAAAEALNEALGKDVFQAGEELLTEGDVAAILKAAGNQSANYKENSTEALTRGEACEALAVLFQLSTGNQSAIEYLCDMGIIQGTADGDLDEDGDINQMQFAIVAQRLFEENGSIPKPSEGEGSTATTPGEGGETTKPGEGGEDTTTSGGSTGFDGLASDWAKDELTKADSLGLIPDCLVGQDLREDITRAEFAAVVVKTYEALAGTAAIPAVNNPFTDCSDVEVLKAYNIGAVNGTSATTYQPDSLLNREQASTMLTRVFKKVSMVGWTLATDSQFSLNYTKPADFADDADISDWAKDSVYFMAANNIMGGVGNNLFAPKNVTTAQQAEGYANATREQALLIAVRMVQNLGS